MDVRPLLVRSSIVRTTIQPPWRTSPVRTARLGWMDGWIDSQLAS